MPENLPAVVPDVLDLLKRAPENLDTILDIANSLLDILEILAEHPEVLEKILGILRGVVNILAMTT